MSTLRDTPFSLAQGTLITAKVKAKNEIGFNNFSAVNTSGVLVQKTPSKPADLTVTEA